MHIMFKKFKPTRPSSIITDLEFPAEVLLIMRSGKILMTSDSLADKGKNHLDGAVFEIMVKMREGAPFFVYYKCDEYYLLVQQQASILDAFKGPEWRTAVSEKIVAFLAKYISYSLKENIGPLMVSYHHNAKHTNVIAYIEKLGEWYPIRHNDNESEDITELRVSDVNTGIADVSKFIAISDLSPNC